MSMINEHSCLKTWCALLCPECTHESYVFIRQCSMKHCLMYILWVTGAYLGCKACAEAMPEAQQGRYC